MDFLRATLPDKCEEKFLSESGTIATGCSNLRLPVELRTFSNLTESFEVRFFMDGTFGPGRIELPMTAENLDNVLEPHILRGVDVLQVNVSPPQLFGEGHHVHDNQVHGIVDTYWHRITWAPRGP